MADDRLTTLKQKYQSVLNAIEQQQARLQNVHIEQNKLLIRAEAPSEEAKNRIWDQIKLVDKSYSDLIADITVRASAQAAGAGYAADYLDDATRKSGGGLAGAQRTYTVQAGDTLSKIARDIYGDASQYRKIFMANQDQLTDPDKIRVGQKLVIPE